MYEDEPVLQAFRLMRLKGVGGIPVIESGGSKAVGNISIRDVQFLLTAPEIYRDCRSVFKELITQIKGEIQFPFIKNMVFVHLSQG